MLGDKASMELGTGDLYCSSFATDELLDVGLALHTSSALLSPLFPLSFSDLFSPKLEVWW